VSVLHSRITEQDYLATPAYHPAGTAETPMTMPVALVSYAANEVLYGSVQPLVTTDGATVPAYADTVYPSPVPAGRA
jgi:hypothetical protein